MVKFKPDREKKSQKSEIYFFGIFIFPSRLKGRFFFDVVLVDVRTQQAMNTDLAKSFFFQICRI